jgi:hypothetical protein
MPNVGPLELIVVLVILGRSLGNGMSEFKDSVTGHDRRERSCPAERPPLPTSRRRGARRRRCPATTSDARRATSGQRYPADPPTVEEIIAVTREASEDRHGTLLIVVSLARRTASPRGARAQRARPRPPTRARYWWVSASVAGAARSGWTPGAGSSYDPDSPRGSSRRSVRCPASSTAPTRGRPWSAGAVRSELRSVARQSGVRRRFAPHQLRCAHAVEMARRACH